MSGMIKRFKCRNCGFSSMPTRVDRCRRCNKRMPEASLDCAWKKPKRKEKSVVKLSVEDKTSVDRNESIEDDSRSRKTTHQILENHVANKSNTQDSHERSASQLPKRHVWRWKPDPYPGVVLTNAEVTRSAMAKEPEIPEEEDEVKLNMQYSESGFTWGPREQELEAIIDGTVPGAYALLQCRTIRIGSYKAVPGNQIMLSTVGVWLSVPTIEDGDKQVTITLDIREIVKVLIHFGRIPVLLFYTISSTGKRIRRLLKMEQNGGPYYDPKSKEETERRIVLLPRRIPVDTVLLIRNIFGRLNLLQMVDKLEANDILVRASPKCAPYHTDVVSIFV